MLDGQEITGLSEDDLAFVRGRKIGFVFQSYHLIPTLTAEENVMLPLELLGDGSCLGRSRARELLDRVGLLDRRDHYPVQLSGGEQQRVALARAFVVRPPVLLADEPTGNLDSANGRLVLDALMELNRRERTTLVLVTHDRDLADSADRQVLLRDGLIVERSTSAIEDDHAAQDCAPRVAGFARQVSFCGPGGGGRSRISDRRPRVQQSLSRHAAAGCANAHGGGS